MSTGIRSLIAALLTLALLAVLWGFLVAAGIPGVLPALLHRRVWSRALGAAVILVILSAWNVYATLRPGADIKEGTEAGTTRRLSTIVPLLLLLALLPAALRTPRTNSARLNIVTGGRVIGTSGTGNAATGSTDLLSAVDELLATQTTSRAPDRAERDALLGRPDPIVIGEDEYARVIDLIWDSPGHFAGRTVETVAFVFRRPEWPGDLFTAARLSVWCCTADASVIGLLAETGSWDAPRDNEWIRVRGEITVLDQFDTGTVTMKNIPVLSEISWEITAAPSFEYVFPADW